MSLYYPQYSVREILNRKPFSRYDPPPLSLLPLYFLQPRSVFAKLKVFTIL